jgi:hypothetical protein
MKIFPVITSEDIERVFQIEKDIDNIIDCALVELLDEYFIIDKRPYHQTNSLTFDILINLENKSGFKISQIQPKVLTVVELMERRYDAIITYQTLNKTKREMFTHFPLFKYDKIKRFKVSIKIM